MTPKHTAPTKPHTHSNPIAAASAFIGWFVATDRAFRRTQAMIDAPGIHF